MSSIITLTITGIFLLLIGHWKKRKWKVPTAIFGLLTAIVLTLLDWDSPKTMFHNMLHIDNVTIAFQVSILTISVLIFLLAVNYYKGIEESVAEIYAMMMFSLVGACLLVSYSNFTTLFIAIETMSIPLYALAGGKKFSIRSNESSLKYFLMGSFASAIFLFGVALIYGTTASFDISKIAVYITQHQNDLPQLFYVGVVLVIIGMAFKVGAVPFHFWVPDVYEGAPTLVTVFMSTIVKTAGFAAFLSLMDSCFFALHDFLHPILWIITALTLVVANLSAMRQNDLKRLLAYSSISHTGFLMISLLAMNEFTHKSILFYTFSYSLANIAAFGVLILVKNSKHADDTFSAFDGLSKNNPRLSFVMFTAMLSLAGIPFTSGFFGKYYLFLSAMKSYETAIVIIAILSALVGIFYYIKIAISMYYREGETPNIESDNSYKVSLFIVSALTLILGIFPTIITGILD